MRLNIRLKIVFRLLFWFQNILHIFALSGLLFFLFPLFHALCEAGFRVDEPFSGVDPIAVEDIQKQLFRLRERGIAVLITDHAVRETLGTTDRAYIMDHGEIVHQDFASHLLADKAIQERYCAV